MKRIFLLIIFFNCQLPTAYCQHSGYWQQEVNFKIDVSLNDVEHTLDGYVKMDYHNHSPDTLHFIWIHLWPNAYKNDRTAFTDQTLENGSTNFYFSDNDRRGYINRLEFKVNGVTAKTVDHPQHQDIVQLILPEPLAPGAGTRIETPFHVKLPANFSRGGHTGQSYQLTQWYPKPAVYDSRGWHPIPYLDQGEFYSEFGNYEVQITVPKNYLVAATGDLQDKDEKIFLRTRIWRFTDKDLPVRSSINLRSKKAEKISSAKETKTLHFKQNNVHDFAWFADKEFVVAHDSIPLPSGRVIEAYAFFYPKDQAIWKNSIRYIRNAILTKSSWIGEYPYNVVTVVEGGNGGGMEYPTITLLQSGGSEQSLDHVIDHEIGHNWFYGILASNERTHPWMDEGMNTYYDTRYTMHQYGKAKAGGPANKLPFLKNILPDDFDQTWLHTIAGLKKDQPIETPSEKFNLINYNLVAYTKTGEWMKLLEEELGQPLFDKCMQTYFERWKFKHPYPGDFKQVMEEISQKNLNASFDLLNKKGDLKDRSSIKKDFRIAPWISFRNTDKHRYLFVAPALGYNFYDKQMFGLLLHNYTLPFPRFRFIAVPLYAAKSKQFNGIGRLDYTRYPGNEGQALNLSLSGETFSGDSFTDSLNKMHYLRFFKIVPSIKYVFAARNPRSSLTRYIQWKTFFIQEQGLLFNRDTTLQLDIISYPNRSRYLNQLQVVFENSRVLYPYSGVLKIEQGDGFVRTDLTGNYFFNYAKGGGMNVRFFAGKFFYTGDKTFTKQFSTDAYHLNMTGAKGNEDYTYSDYFIGRNEFDRFSSQQIMIRDGGFKVRTDQLSDKVGKTDNWLAALNFTSDIPREINPLSLLPFKFPLRVFLDIGTYAGAWKKNAPTGRFIYDAGLQLSLLRNVINIYVPILYSKVYSNYFKSTIIGNQFLKNIAFSIDLKNLLVPFKTILP